MQPPQPPRRQLHHRERHELTTSFAGSRRQRAGERRNEATELAVFVFGTHAAARRFTRCWNRQDATRRRTSQQLAPSNEYRIGSAWHRLTRCAHGKHQRDILALRCAAERHTRIKSGTTKRGKPRGARCSATLRSDANTGRSRRPCGSRTCCVLRCARRESAA